MNQPTSATVSWPDTTTALVTVRETALDSSTKDGLDAVLREAWEAGAVRIVVNLSAVTFCDSSGLAVLVRAHRRALDRQGWVRQAGTTGHPERLISLTNLGRLVRAFPSAEAAMSADAGV